MPGSSNKVVAENVNVPGLQTNVDAEMYEVMKSVFLKVLPSKEPGLTQNEIREMVKQYLPDDLFPGGEKSGWWRKWFSSTGRP